jgi:hypothetical protein
LEVESHRTLFKSKVYFQYSFINIKYVCTNGDKGITHPRPERGFKVDEITLWEGGGGGEVRW